MKNRVVANLLKDLKIWCWDQTVTGVVFWETYQVVRFKLLQVWLPEGLIICWDSSCYHCGSLESSSGTLAQANSSVGIWRTHHVLKLNCYRCDFQRNHHAINFRLLPVWFFDEHIRHWYSRWYWCGSSENVSSAKIQALISLIDRLSYCLCLSRS